MIQSPPLAELAANPHAAMRFYFSTLMTTPEADRTAALANGEAQAFVHGDRLLGDQLHLHFDVIARHAHFGLLPSEPINSTMEPVTSVVRK